jgi:putative nucleotidyltransferase with HDIG domain
MIPTENQAKALWDKYALPEKKRIHVALVSRVAVFLAAECEKHTPGLHIDVSLLRASALLHDIDKAIPKLQGEKHPDTGVRVLREEDMKEVAEVVKTHSLHSILDPAIEPTTWEEKLLYLADKMVKLEIITVDERFALWRSEDLPSDAHALLDACYPRVKKLEKEILDIIHRASGDIAKLA